MRASLSIILLCTCLNCVFAQEFEWNIGMHGFIDNKEFSKVDFLSPTILGTRFSPEVGLRIDGVHSLRIGFNSLNEFGDKHNFVKDIDPVIYYQYQKDRISFLFGAFPRHSNLMKYPGALLKNDLQYFRPNLEGFLITYRVPKYQQQLWLDWTSKQSEIDREGFIIGFAGKYKPSSFYVSHHFTLWHNALTSVENADEHIRDNGAFTASIGYDASRLTFLDSLDVQLGGLISMDRLRNVYKWRTPKGVLLGAYLAYQAFFIKETWYIGDSQEIGFGDPFYQFKNYNRLDLGWKAFQSKNLEASVGTSFHFAKGAMLNQQQLSLRYSIGGNIPIHSLNKGSAMNHF